MTEADKLHRVHVLRFQAHWGKNFDLSHEAWPQTEADWRQTPHGAPWDANVHMAKWHLALAQTLKDEGLLS